MKNGKNEIRFGDFGKWRRGCHIEHNDHTNDDKRVNSSSNACLPFSYVGIFLRLLRLDLPFHKTH